MRTLRDILKLCRLNARLTDADAEVVRSNVIASSSTSDRIKELAGDGSTWYCVKSVVWGRRKHKCIHLCYEGGTVPLTLTNLEARPKKARKVNPVAVARAKVMKACRDIIRPQITEYREAYWEKYESTVRANVSLGMAPPRSPRCPLTGKSLKACQTHVDHHKVPFVTLVEQWVLATGGTFEDLARGIKSSRALGRMTFGTALVDNSWYNYHADEAILVLVEAKANMSKGAK